MPVEVGKRAPDFTLSDEQGNVQTLSMMQGEKVVLYFYPKDFTPGCTKQACSIRDGFTQLDQEGITVWGISSDSVQSHQKFKEKYQLPFILLSDEAKKVIKLYGAQGLLFTSRVTFLINEKGVVIAKLDDVDVEHHAQQIIDAFKKAL